VSASAASPPRPEAFIGDSRDPSLAPGARPT